MGERERTVRPGGLTVILDGPPSELSQLVLQLESEADSISSQGSYNFWLRMMYLFTFKIIIQNKPARVPLESLDQ